jgi:hypothetical protein
MNLELNILRQMEAEAIRKSPRMDSQYKLHPDHHSNPQIPHRDYHTSNRMAPVRYMNLELHILRQMEVEEEVVEVAVCIEGTMLHKFLGLVHPREFLYNHLVGLSHISPIQLGNIHQVEEVVALCIEGTLLHKLGLHSVHLRYFLGHN